MKRYLTRRLASAAVLLWMAASVVFFSVCPTEPGAHLAAISVEGMRVAVPLDMEDVAPPETGSLSDPGLGTPERGRVMFEHAAEACTRFLRWFRGIDPYLDGAQGKA